MARLLIIYGTYGRINSKLLLINLFIQLWNESVYMYNLILSCIPKKHILIKKGFPHLNNSQFKETLRREHKSWIEYMNYPWRGTYDAQALLRTLI